MVSGGWQLSVSRLSSLKKSVPGYATIRPERGTLLSDLRTKVQYIQLSEQQRFSLASA